MVIRIGMIGAGGISSVHLEALAAHPQVEIACIADPDPVTRARQVERYGIARSVSDYREMLEDQSIDAVDIAIPHFLHCAATLDALSAGKHVLCEKPIGLNLEQADAMIAAAAASDVRLLVKKYLRSAEHHQMAKALLDDNEIGEVYAATGRVVVQQLAIENDADNWRGTWEKAGGGVLIDAGIHLVDLMQHWLGPVSAVSATTRRLVADHPGKADDTASVTLEHTRGALTTIVCANCDTSLPRMVWEKALFGTRGSLHMFQVGELTKLVHAADGRTRELASVPGWWESANIAAVTHLIDCLLDGTEPVASLEEARHDLEVVLAAYQASSEGRRVSLRDSSD